MGTGCNNGCNKHKFFGQVTPDNQVTYTGPAIPSLGICTGDSLTEIEAVLIDAIVAFAKGENIHLETVDFSNYEVASQFAASADNNSLPGVVDVLAQSIDHVQGNLEQVVETVDSGFSFVVDPKCLTIVANNQLEPVLQALVDKSCELQEAFLKVFTTLESPTFTPEILEQLNIDLLTKVFTNITSNGNTGIEKTGTGANQAIKFTALVPPMCPIFYVGSLANFDEDGKGIEAAGYGGWFLCNGNNGTPDLRGWTIAGANTAQGPLLNPAVDHVALGDSDMQTGMGSRKGKYKHTLSTPELPSHDHPLNDPTHTHTYDKPVANPVLNPAPSDIPSNNFALAPAQTAPSATNITIGLTGNNEPHENRPPTYYGAFIMRFN